MFKLQIEEKGRKEEESINQKQMELSRRGRRDGEKGGRKEGIRVCLFLITRTTGVDNRVDSHDERRSLSKDQRVS